MGKYAIQIILIVVAVVFGSSLIHLATGFLTGQMVANKMKEYEQRWKEDDERIKKMEEEIAQLEKKRDELHAAAKKEMVAAAAVSDEGMKRHQELTSRKLTVEETAAANGTAALKPERLDGAKEGGAPGGAKKGKIKWGDDSPAPAAEVAK